MGEAPVEWAGGGVVARFERGESIGKTLRAGDAPQRLIRNAARSRSVPTQWRHIRRSQRRRSARKLGAAAVRGHEKVPTGVKTQDILDALGSGLG